MKKMTTLILMILSLAACARGSSDNSHKTSEQRTVLVNGEKPEDYFNRFLYRVTGSCKDTSLYIHFLSTDSNGIKLKNSDDNKTVKALIEIFLNKDHTYQANYEERTVQYLIDNGYGFKVSFKKKLSGNWSINENGQIELSEIGTGSALKYNGQPAVQVKSAIDIHQSGLAGQEFILSMVYTSGDEEIYSSACN